MFLHFRFVETMVLIVLTMASIADAQPANVPAVLISRQLAAAEGLAVGDLIVLSDDPKGIGSRQFRIAGVYEPTPDPMRLAVRRLEARLHLPDLISLTSRASDPSADESVTAINVKLRDPQDAAAFARDVRRAIPVQDLTARTARGGEGSAPLFVVLDRFHFAIALVTIIASTTFLMALMMMLVDERRQVMGILRLIGMRQRRLLLQVVLEGVIVAVTGALFGILLAAGLQRAVNVFFQWRYDTALVFVRITPRIALQCALFAVPLGVLASLVSSWTLLRTGVLNLAKR
jgi:putative ABC transport system permease protein